MTATGSTYFILEIQGLQAEIERLKAQHEEMLLKHAREQGIALDLLEAAIAEVERYKALLGRGAEALECHNLDHLQDALIAELREAAE